MKNLDPARAAWMRKRILFVTALLALFGSAVARKGYRLHVADADELSAQAERQYRNHLRLTPRRGSIYDRHGAPLAITVDTFHVWANPVAIRANGVDFASLARTLSPLVGVDETRILGQLNRAASRHYVRIALQVPRDAANRVNQYVRDQHVPGLGTEVAPRRFYPNRDLAAHILGFVDVDGHGREGLELAFDGRLRGREGMADALRDGRRRVIYSDRFFDDSGDQGQDLELTLDEGIQRLVERELELAVLTYEARGASAVVMDPRTGEILGMASYPTFNPNLPGRSDQQHHRNRVVQDRFEPGSTVKPFVVAAALDVGSIRAEQPIDVEGGILRVEGGKEIRDSHPAAFLTPSGILAQSSNIGAAKIGLSLGRAGLYRALRRFGFGEEPGLPLSGESSGSLPHYRRWYERDAMSIAFGQGMSSSTVQLASAMCVIANGGRLMRAHLVRSVRDPNGRIVESFPPEVVRQVVRPDTARLVADMLIGVTGPTGTAPEAAIDGYLTAGKTGTAQKANLLGTGYDPSRFVTSFVGFAPARAPRVVIAVVLDEPAIDHVAGQVAAPVFRRIGAGALRQLGTPSTGGGQALVEHQRLEGQRERERRRIEQEIRRGSRDERRVAAPDSSRPADASLVRVPDLTGDSAREVVVALGRLELSTMVHGSGVVTTQNPPAGTDVARGTVVNVELAPPEVMAPLPPLPPSPPPARVDNALPADPQVRVASRANERRRSR